VRALKPQNQAFLFRQYNNTNNPLGERMTGLLSRQSYQQQADRNGTPATDQVTSHVKKHRRHHHHHSTLFSKSKGKNKDTAVEPITDMKEKSALTM
jgi:hypothetical protein